MINKKNIENRGFFNKEANRNLNKRLPEIKKEVMTYAYDLAGQSRPREHDAQVLFLPKIQGLFDALLQHVLRIIGAFSVLNQTGETLKEIYKREVAALKAKKEALLEDVRVLQKDLSSLKDISHRIRKWVYKWRLVLIALSIGEVAVNYRILLIVTPNQLTAIVASLGLCTVLFVIAHSLKDILVSFSSRAVQWGIGSGVVLGVLALLWNLNTIRISYMQNDAEEISDISEWSFVIINFSMWIAGAIIALLYKPLKSEVAAHHRYQKVKQELKPIQKEIKEINDRLAIIPGELDQKILDIEHLNYMAKHYEMTLCREYESSVAEFVSENLFRRKDKVSPKAFLEKPTPLHTYFDHIHANS